MSASLVWYYEVKKDIPDNLRRILENNFSISSGYQLSTSEVPFLRGLEAAEVKGADVLIKAIEKYGEIYLKWEC